jgi:hypothetical protein
MLRRYKTWVHEMCIYLLQTPHLDVPVRVQDPEGKSLWDLTWNKVRTISSGLTPQILAAPLMAAEEAAPAPPPTASASPPTGLAPPGDAGAHPAGLHQGTALPGTPPGEGQGMATGTAAALPLPSTADGHANAPGGTPVSLLVPGAERVSVEIEEPSRQAAATGLTEGEHSTPATLRGSDVTPGAQLQDAGSASAQTLPALSGAPPDAADVTSRGGEFQGVRSQGSFMPAVAAHESGTVAGDAEMTSGMAGMTLPEAAGQAPELAELGSEDAPSAHLSAER